jgi:hypothetical protein
LVVEVLVEELHNQDHPVVVEVVLVDIFQDQQQLAADQLMQLQLVLVDPQEQTLVIAEATHCLLVLELQ